MCIPSHKGEMGDLGVSLWRFLISSLDLPRRASCSLTNLRFARRCWGVCACNRSTEVVSSQPASSLHTHQDRP